MDTGTKPQTPAVTLTGTPAGLGVRIIEKLRAWSDCGGDVETAFTRDRLLANIGVGLPPGSARLAGPIMQ